MRDAFFIRVNRGETLQTVASATLLDPDTISDLEKGETKHPSARTLKTLAAYYEVDVRDLMTTREAAA